MLNDGILSNGDFSEEEDMPSHHTKSMDIRSPINDQHQDTYGLLQRRVKPKQKIVRSTMFNKQPVLDRVDI